MNLVSLMTTVVGALMTKSGSFSVHTGKAVRTVTITASGHTNPLGRLNFTQTLNLAQSVAAGSTSFTVRLGSNDFAVTVS